MIIDTHVHVWDQHSERTPHHRLTPPPAVPVEHLINTMEKAGVTHAVLIQPSLYGFDNTYIADCLRKYPGKLTGVGCVDVRSKEVTGQLRYWVEECGLRGVRLMPIADPQDDLLGQPGTHNIFKQAADLSIPISLFVGPRHMDQVSAMTHEYPDTKVVIEHLGRPDDSKLGLIESIQPLLQLTGIPSVYVKVSGLHVISKESYPYPDTYAMIQLIWKAFGSRRMLWGSDFPGVLKNYGDRISLEFLKNVPTKTPLDLLNRI